jgi:predicted ArsR family transcriptional regulator
MEVPPRPAKRWFFLTNHALVLLSIARDANVRIRQMAAEIGITERAVQQIVRDLEEAGYITIRKLGRRNSYEVRPDRRFRHPLHHDHAVGELLEVLVGGGEGAQRAVVGSGSAGAL